MQGTEKLKPYMGPEPIRLEGLTDLGRLSGSCPEEGLIN